jgi:hypothetical protein
MSVLGRRTIQSLEPDDRLPAVRRHHLLEDRRAMGSRSKMWIAVLAAQSTARIDALTD